MAVAFRAAGTVGAGVGNVTYGLPTGHALNDILLLYVETSAQTPPATFPPTGWVEVADSPQATPSVNAGAAAANTQIHVLWKRHDGSETDPTVVDPGNHQVGVIVAYTGCVTTGDPWDVTAGGASATNDTALTVGGDTTTVANTMVVIGVGLSLGITNAGDQCIGSWANADLGSIAERADYLTLSGNDGVIAVVEGTKAAAGLFGNTTATLTSNSRKAWHVLALKPAAGGLSVNAGIGTSTGAANAPTAKVAPTVPVATATGLARTPGTGRRAGIATATGAASKPATKVAPNAGTAAATGLARTPGTARTAGIATATGAAYGASVSIKPAAGIATATGTARQPAASIKATAGMAAATGAAGQPAAHVKPAAGISTATGAAYGATARVGASAGTAAATGVARTPAASVKPSPAVATATGAAATPAAHIKPTAGVATATGLANAATVTIGGALSVDA